MTVIAQQLQVLVIYQQKNKSLFDDFSLTAQRLFIDLTTFSTFTERHCWRGKSIVTSNASHSLHFFFPTLTANLKEEPCPSLKTHSTLGSMSIQELEVSQVKIAFTKTADRLFIRNGSLTITFRTNEDTVGECFLWRRYWYLSGGGWVRYQELVYDSLFVGQWRLVTFWQSVHRFGSADQRWQSLNLFPELTNMGHVWVIEFGKVEAQSFDLLPMVISNGWSHRASESYCNANHRNVDLIRHSVERCLSLYRKGNFVMFMFRCKFTYSWTLYFRLASIKWTARYDSIQFHQERFTYLDFYHNSKPTKFTLAKPFHRSLFQS